MCIGECNLLCWRHALAVYDDLSQLNRCDRVVAVELAFVVMRLCAVYCEVHEYDRAESADSKKSCAFDCADDVHDVPFQCQCVYVSLVMRSYFASVLSSAACLLRSVTLC